jgi:hypothetical protein
MHSEIKPSRSLREIEEETLAEGREWMRQRLQQKLQEEADRHGQVFPPQSTTGVASKASPPASAHLRRCD